MFFLFHYIFRYEYLEGCFAKFRKKIIYNVDQIVKRNKIAGRKADHSARLCNLQLHANVMNMWLVFNLDKNNTSV